MSTRFRRGRAARIAAAVGISAVALWAAGCGSAQDFESADLEAGKTAFAGCAACHSLADAGATGSDTGSPTAGPNLDDAFRASRQVGIPDDQFAGVVHRWIKYAQMPMPRDMVEGQDAINVAAYVASVAGKSDESVVRKAAPEPPEAPNPPRQEIDPE